MIFLIIILNMITEFDLFTMSIIIPLSTNRITFQQEFEEIDWYQKVEYFIIKKFSAIEIIRFLGNLDPQESYICSIDLITDLDQYHKSDSRIFLTDPFLINKNISASLLAEFIFNNGDVKFLRKSNMKTILIINFSKIAYYK
jgi:hypothetical protein